MKLPNLVIIISFLTLFTSHADTTDLSKLYAAITKSNVATLIINTLKKVNLTQEELHAYRAPSQELQICQKDQITKTIEISAAIGYRLLSATLCISATIFSFAYASTLAEGKTTSKNI